jgi:hypothetical protein
MSEAVEVNEVPDVDETTLLGLVMVVTCVAMGLTFSKMANLTFDLVVMLGVVGTVACATGLTLIKWRMAYRAFLGRPVLWLCITALTAAQGIVTAEIIVLALLAMG